MSDQITPLKLDHTGTLRVGRVEISLDDIILAHQKGATPEAILARFPGLTTTELHAALDYHLSQGSDAVPRGPEQRDAHWRKWNASLEDDMGTDTPPNEPIAASSS